MSSQELIDALVEYGDLDIRTALALATTCKHGSAAVRAKMGTIVANDRGRFCLFGLMRALGHRPHQINLTTAREFRREFRDGLRNVPFLINSFDAVVACEDLYRHPEWHDFFLEMYSNIPVVYGDPFVFMTTLTKALGIMLRHDNTLANVLMMLRWLTVKIRDMYRFPWLIEFAYKQYLSCPVTGVHKRIRKYERFFADANEDDRQVLQDAKKLIAMMICTFAYGRKPWFALHEGENGSVYYVMGGGRKRYVTDFIRELM